MKTNGVLLTFLFLTMLNSLIFLQGIPLSFYSIENLPGVDDKARDGMIGKMGELNRVSPHSKYQDFCEEKGVLNSDLWFVYARSRYLSLYDIRNGLAHGKRNSSGRAGRK